MKIKYVILGHMYNLYEIIKYSKSLEDMTSALSITPASGEILGMSYTKNKPGCNDKLEMLFTIKGIKEEERLRSDIKALYNIRLYYVNYTTLTVNNYRVTKSKYIYDGKIVSSLEALSDELGNKLDKSKIKQFKLDEETN